MIVPASAVAGLAEFALGKPWNDYPLEGVRNHRIGLALRSLSGPKAALLEPEVVAVDRHLGSDIERQNLSEVVERMVDVMEGTL